MIDVLARMGRSDLTVHGFRSSFRDWAAECTKFHNEVAEHALAHTVGDKTSARTCEPSSFPQRTRLMAAWAKYCQLAAGTGPKEGVVVPIGAGR